MSRVIVLPSEPCKDPDLGNPWTSTGRCQRCGWMLSAHRISRFRAWLARW